MKNKATPKKKPASVVKKAVKTEYVVITNHGEIAKLSKEEFERHTKDFRAMLSEKNKQAREQAKKVVDEFLKKECSRSDSNTADALGMAMIAEKQNYGQTLNTSINEHINEIRECILQQYNTLEGIHNQIDCFTHPEISKGEAVSDRKEPVTIMEKLVAITDLLRRNNLLTLGAQQRLQKLI